jgi:hypothetical protein
MKFSLIGLSDDSVYLSKLVLVAYDLEQYIATIADSIPLSGRNRTLESYREYEEEGFDVIPEPYYSEILDEVDAKVLMQAVRILDFFRKTSIHQFADLSYGEIRLVPINHKEREFGIVLILDEDDTQSLNDFQRNELIGRALDLPGRWGALQ